MLLVGEREARLTDGRGGSEKGGRLEAAKQDPSKVNDCVRRIVR